MRREAGFADLALVRAVRRVAVETRAEFPRNALGKVLKRLLREPYWQRTDG